MSDPARLRSEDHQTIWQLITERLQEELPRQSFLTWFKPLESLSFTDNVLTLRIPSQFYYDWIESHYRSHLQRAMSDTLGSNIELAYEIKPSRPVEKRGVKPNPAKAVATSARNDLSSSNNLNNRYRFDNFIEGDCNRFARAAGMSLAEAPGRTPFNPLLIYGGSGLGKTHLMQAIGNHIVENRYARRIMYVTSEQFTSDFIKSIQSNKTDSFSRTYRKADVLLIDDVQFFMAKDKTQEEFFHTFNSLHQAGKQLVFSSDRPPRDLEGFNERLVSRLQWGLVAELRSPEYETRLAILRCQAQEDGIELPDDVANFLAMHITSNVRSLQSALIHLLAQSSLVRRKITIDLARDVIKNLSSNQVVKSISVDQIQDVVASEFEIPSDLLRSKTRKKEIVHARQIAMFLTAEYTRLTLKAIGLHFGGRDHATVIHARKIVGKMIGNDPVGKDVIESLRHKLELISL